MNIGAYDPYVNIKLGDANPIEGNMKEPCFYCGKDARCQIDSRSVCYAQGCLSSHSHYNKLRSDNYDSRFQGYPTITRAAIWFVIGAFIGATAAAIAFWMGK